MYGNVQLHYNSYYDRNVVEVMLCEHSHLKVNQYYAASAHPLIIQVILCGIYHKCVLKYPAQFPIHENKCSCLKTKALYIFHLKVI